MFAFPITKRFWESFFVSCNISSHYKQKCEKKLRKLIFLHSILLIFNCLLCVVCT